jgi:acyl-coenzyme A synthetase/AMP-(fatty) acid ligase
MAEGDVVLHAGAFNWTYTLGVGLTDPWANGAVAAIHGGPRDPAIWAELIERLGATIFAAVPGIYRQMLEGGGDLRRRLEGLRHGLTAGEPLPAATLEGWRAATGLELYEAFGMSEISTWVSQAPPGPARPGTPGRPQAGRLVAVLPVEGGLDPLPVGEVGLIAIHRSDPGLMLGYWNRPLEEASAWRGEWFVSGDLAAIDGDGLVRYHGRDDDVMNAGGYRVSPLEVEAALALHPGVAEAAVAERRVAEATSIVVAWVVPHEAAALAPAAVLGWLEGRLAAYKRPREVHVVPSLPRSPNGKLLRRLLRR